MDEPQGFKSSVPPVTQATSDIALVRFHGRNRATWEKQGLTTAERFNYLYTEDELADWVPRIKGPGREDAGSATSSSTTATRTRR